MRTFGKGFWWTVALLTGLCLYIVLMAFALPQLAKTPYSDSPFAWGLAILMLWPGWVVYHLPVWFGASPVGTVLIWGWIIVAGPGLFIGLWTWLFLAVVRHFTGTTRSTQPHAGQVSSEAAPSAAPNEPSA